VPITELTPNLGGRWFNWDGADLHASDALPSIAVTTDRYTE